MSWAELFNPRWKGRVALFDGSQLGLLDAGNAAEEAGNRQLNAAIHRIALTQAHWHPAAQAMIARRRGNGDGSLGALRVLKRRLSDVVYRALRTDLTATHAEAA